MKIFQIDAFTDRPFAGNPAAVCRLETFPQSSRMQLLAREMNLSETAFLVARGDEFGLRWFTPGVEVDLCGHATLASAHLLFSSGAVDERREAIFHTRSGPLAARQRASWIEMDFPAHAPRARVPAPGLLEALGAEPRYVGWSGSDWLVEVGSESELRDLDPDAGRLRALCPRGVIVTSAADGSDFDFVSRFFAPAVGVDEDPVTGSAHCCLGPFWSERLGRTQLVGYQASARGGVVRVESRGERVLLAGRAVTVLECDLLVPWPVAG